MVARNKCFVHTTGKWKNRATGTCWVSTMALLWMVKFIDHSGACAEPRASNDYGAATVDSAMALELRGAFCSCTVEVLELIAISRFVPKYH